MLYLVLAAGCGVGAFFTLRLAYDYFQFGANVQGLGSGGLGIALVVGAVVLLSKWYRSSHKPRTATPPVRKKARSSKKTKRRKK